jgi:hypothetical protein
MSVAAGRFSAPYGRLCLPRPSPPWRPQAGLHWPNLGEAVASAATTPRSGADNFQRDPGADHQSNGRRSRSRLNYAEVFNRALGSSGLGVRTHFRRPDEPMERAQTHHAVVGDFGASAIAGRSSPATDPERHRSAMRASELGPQRSWRK